MTVSHDLDRPIGTPIPGRAGLPGHAISPGRRDLSEACALAAAPIGSESVRNAHPGYTLDQLVLRCWALGVPPRGCTHKELKLVRDDFEHVRRKRGVHRFEHTGPAGNQIRCFGGHNGGGSYCGATTISLGDDSCCWRHDGVQEIEDCDIPSSAKARLGAVRLDLLKAGYSDADIDATPSIEQIIELLAALPAESPKSDNGDGPPHSARASEIEAQEVKEVEEAIRRGTDTARRRAVEENAMDVAMSWYRDAGWNVDDVSATESFDLLCTRGGEELHVEVKGRSTEAATVILTHNEVEHARDRNHRTELFVVSNITVSSEKDGTPAASGGDCVVYGDAWQPDDDDLTPLAYTYRLPSQT